MFGRQHLPGVLRHVAHQTTAVVCCRRRFPHAQFDSRPGRVCCRAGRYCRKPGVRAIVVTVQDRGTVSDYTDALNTAAGPWNITGNWLAELRGRSGRVDFIVSLAMVRSTTGAASHTHHVALLDATVTRIANGYRISGDAVITNSGGPAPFSGSPHRGDYWRRRGGVLERQADLRRSGGRPLRGPADRGSGDASALNPTNTGGAIAVPSCQGGPRRGTRNRAARGPEVESAPCRRFPRATRS